MSQLNTFWSAETPQAKPSEKSGKFVKKKKKKSEKEEFYVDLYTGSLVTRGALFCALECKPRKVQITKQIRPGHFLTEL